MAILNELTAQLSGNLARQKDELLIAAARSVAGPDGTIYDLARRGELQTYPDGTEVFVFDGVAMIKFWPVEFETVTDGLSHKLKATRRYQTMKTPTSGS